MRTNLNERIRQYLETLDHPTWPHPVAVALKEPSSSVRNALSSMRRAGLVMYQEGLGYMAGGRKPLTAKEASMLGGIANAARSKKPAKRPKPIVMVPRKLGVTETAAVRETFPDTDAFIQANPHLHEVLPAGMWSTSLRFEY